jgi:hypothetical protein
MASSSSQSSRVSGEMSHESRKQIVKYAKSTRQPFNCNANDSQRQGSEEYKVFIMNELVEDVTIGTLKRPVCTGFKKNTTYPRTALIPRGADRNRSAPLDGRVDFSEILGFAE